MLRAAVLPTGLAAASHTAAADRPPQRRVRAVLPADTRAPQPVSGTAVGPALLDVRRVAVPDDKITRRPITGRR